ncbi:ATP-grasp domain-containing protein [Clostridium sartagoforme]|uniref:ATP-grasp domain-containing protein n=1 Tax=Clostridium sartagoforme TaxID=84031 RepID=A0A4S2DL01_9CLOT|nr:ATP-grasp domain-containing protein [Clostridium sartagoforme]TGY42352.1 ATP-grasp domain-containing protein [Clostridium sartagoforme]
MKKKVAVFPAGTEIGLEINRALGYSIHIELYGLTSIRDHSRFVYKNYIEGLPFYNEDNFIIELNKIIEVNEIDFIFPANDDVQLFLTKNKELIKAEILTSDLETVKICRSKLETYNYFDKENFVPRFFENTESISEYPIFAKPDVGQGAKGAKIINNLEELNEILNKDEKYVICEYLPGEEYTIDCFTDFNGNLRVCKMRNRKRIRTGISVNSEILEMDDEVLNIATIINNKLKFNGAWFFQLKRDANNKYKLLEIATRISGTMGLSRNLGINYPLLTIYNSMNMEVKIIENKYNIEVDRAFISRFKLDFDYETVYVDLDDTLIIDGNVNKFLMLFIYQSLNDNKKIKLVSKHIHNISDTLKSKKIDINIFDEIIHLKNIDKKSAYLFDKKAIFIDDSFAERYDVVSNLNIPVFDNSEIESLIDWRR